MDEEEGHSEGPLELLDLSALSGTAGMYPSKLTASWVLVDIAPHPTHCFPPGSHLAVSFQTPSEMMVGSLVCTPPPFLSPPLPLQLLAPLALEDLHAWLPAPTLLLPPAPGEPQSEHHLAGGPGRVPCAYMLDFVKELDHPGFP